MPNEQYNQASTLFWSMEGDIIKNLISQEYRIGVKELLAFFYIYFAFTCITYGTNVPAGLFLPGMVVGCMIGAIWMQLLDSLQVFPEFETGEEEGDFRTTLIILGCSGMLAGYTGMTYSICIIMMETSMRLNLFVPIVFTIFISSWVSSFFTRGLYQRAVRGMQLPILSAPRIPCANKHLLAENIMARDLVTLDPICNMSDIQTALESGHHQFPVNSNAGYGLISRNYIITIIKYRGFYDAIL